MIRLTNIDGEAIYVNPANISSMEARPSIHTNAFVYMTNGVMHEVREKVEAIVKMMRENQG